MSDMTHDDEFDEFETTPEEILAVLDSGELVDFGSRFTVTKSTLPSYEPTSTAVEHADLVPVG